MKILLGKSFYRRFFKFLFVGFSSILFLCYLPVLAIYHITPRQSFPIGILGIGFIYLWPAVVIISLLWFFFNKKIGAYGLLLAILGLPIAKNAVAVRSSAFTLDPPKGSIRIMQWNCMNLPGIYPNSTEAAQRQAAVTMLKTYRPDIICLQDFTVSKGVLNRSNLNLMIDTLGYKFYNFNIYYNEIAHWGSQSSGTAVFSKLPIQDSGKLFFTDRQYPEGICWITVNVGGKPLKIASTHLQSMNLKHKPTDPPVNTYQYEDSNAIMHFNILQKLSYFQAYHAIQASTIASFIDSNLQQPLVLGADLNSVPASYVYGQVGRKMQDAFLKKGSGIGGTYHTKYHGVRIDYLFANAGVNILQFKNIEVGFFNHNPQVVDIQLR